MPKVDWNELKSEYATTKLSLRKLAEKHGISFNTLKDHAAKEQWKEARDGFNKKVVTETVQKVVKKSATVCAKNLNKLGKSADNMAVVIEKILQDSEQFRRHLIEVRTGVGTGKGVYEDHQEVEERIYEKYDTKAIKDICSAMKDVSYVIRNVYDLPTMQEAAAMELAIKRLTLDTQKAGQNDTDDNETGVVILPPILAEVEDVKDAE